MKARILVVDDDEALAEMIGIVLRNDGFEPVFCADGAHRNPNPSVVRTLLETRIEADPERPFTVWFNCSEERTIPQRRKAMRAALKEARRLEARHTEQVTVRVLADDEPFLEIEV